MIIENFFIIGFPFRTLNICNFIPFRSTILLWFVICYPPTLHTLEISQMAIAQSLTLYKFNKTTNFANSRDLSNGNCPIFYYKPIDFTDSWDLIDGDLPIFYSKPIDFTDSCDLIDGNCPIFYSKSIDFTDPRDLIDGNSILIEKSINLEFIYQKWIHNIIHSKNPV